LALRRSRRIAIRDPPTGDYAIVWGASGSSGAVDMVRAMAPIPPLPASFDRADLESAGFVGWRTWDELRASDLRTVPSGPAVYVVSRTASGDPVFLANNPGGRFKEKDPTVGVEVLASNWVPSSQVVYIGKADVANRRLKQFAGFGAGEKIGHWGGRYIWQLADSERLLVAWHAISWTELARDYEKRLRAHFAERHGGVRPFANLTG
jgi:hypothetical protein